VQALFERRGHRIPDTRSETLTALAADDPLAHLILALREAEKQASVYGENWVDRWVHPGTGRVYGNWFQLGARTGRMSCSKPNLQNVPKQRAYRACFRPPPGSVFVRADFSQIELRIAAELTGDRQMLAEFQRDDADLHRRTAQLILGRNDITDEDRQRAKAVNFGLVYGMLAETLREYAATDYGVPLTLAEARRFRQRFFAGYLGLQKWHRGQRRGARDTRTLAGRLRRGIARLPEKLNSPVQGSGADGLKLALALLWERRDRCPTAKPVLAVHDEVVIECPAEDAEQTQEWLVAAMRDGMQPLLPRVPVIVEPKIIADWSGAPA
jgi:DNA polymerase-1